MKESKTKSKDGLWIRINKCILLASSIATIICAIPVIKQCFHSVPKAHLYVGTHEVTEDKDISLYYIIKRGKGVKYQLPMPFKLLNKSQDAVCNLSITLSAEMKPVANTNGGFMLRLIGNNDITSGNKQTLVIPIDKIPSKSTIGMENYCFNVIDEKNNDGNTIVKEAVNYLYSNLDGFVWDSCDYNMNITHDIIDRPIIVKCRVYCLYNDCMSELEEIVARNSKDKSAFAIYVADDSSYNNEDGNSVQRCKIIQVKKIHV